MTQHAPERSPRIRASELTKRYSGALGSPAVLESLSFDVFPGEIVSIVGPSGIGKTTLLKCITGLHALSSGTVLVDGEPLTGPHEDIALVFQDYTRSLMPWLTVAKNIRLPLHRLRLATDERERRITSAISAVGLNGTAANYPWQLSGGMQQRVALARAIAYRPEVLVMDEPFASVDAQTRFELEDLCLGIREQFGMTIVLVTHDIDEAVYLSDRVVVLGGRPARVLRTIDVTLPAERSQMETRALPEFALLRNEIFQLIRDDAHC